MSQSEPFKRDLAHPSDAECAAAMQLQIAGRADLAEPLFRSVLRRQPQHAAANYCLGMLLVQLRRTTDALPHLLEAVNVQPEISDYWLGYLEALVLLGQETQAHEILQLARRHGLGGKAVEDFAARLQSRCTPTSTRAARRRQASSLGRREAALFAIVEAGRFSDALSAARQLTEDFPQHGVGWKILAAMIWAAEPPENALHAMYRSVELLPQDAEAHSNLGNALNKLRRLDAAETWLRRAIEIDANFGAAHSQLGDTYQLQGRYAAAEASFRRAIELFPREFSSATDAPHSGLLFMLNHNPQVDAETLFAEHCRVGAYLERSASQVRVQQSNDPDPERCLQVGLVSADLRNHAVANFVEPLLRQWADSATIRISVYYGYPSEDDVSARLRGYVAHWHSIFGVSNEILARRIADDRIDILIDLSGHSSMHRLAAFAHKPAPVQASWLGYPATTGMRSMDYYMADKYFLPPGQFERYFSEKLVHLPVVWGFEPFVDAPPVNRLPALDSGTLSFGSFNRLGKINEATIQLWSALLRELPAATLKLAGVPLDSQHHRLIEWFAQAGIARERLTFHPYTTMEAHLALHHEVDIALEPTPYTGCTTSNHALWMGVPPLTLAGSTPASRLCAANLGHLGLEQFIAWSHADFVKKGVYWASRLDALAALRQGLRARWQVAPARDPAFVAAGFERGLRRMWRRWCAGLPPAAFELAADELE